MSLRIVEAGNGATGTPDANKLVKIIGEAVKPFGFQRKDEHLLQSDLTIYSLRTANPNDLINVIIDRKTLTITLVEYRQQRSTLDGQVKKALEAQIAAAYGTTVQFTELPCARMDT